MTATAQRTEEDYCEYDDENARAANALINRLQRRKTVQPMSGEYGVLARMIGVCELTGSCLVRAGFSSNRLLKNYFRRLKPAATKTERIDFSHGSRTL